MASIRKEIETKARPDDVWAAIADIGALHTRLVPGFVVDTRLEPGARVVTFGNGMVVREPIVTIDGTSRRLVWTARRRSNDALQCVGPGLFAGRRNDGRCLGRRLPARRGGELYRRGD
jgi:hypothetical protein